MVDVGKYSIRGAFVIHICPHIFFSFFLIFPWILFWIDVLGWSDFDF